jgi:protein TonB
MKKLLLLTVLCCALFTSRAQTADTAKAPPLPAHGADPDGDGPAPGDSSRVFVKMTDPPTFPGGLDSLHRYLSRKMVYPPALLAARKGGKLVVSFIVEKDGSLSKLTVPLSPGTLFTAQVLKAFEGLHFLPGRQNGHVERAFTSVVIRFDPDYPGIF